MIEFSSYIKSVSIGIINITLRFRDGSAVSLLSEVLISIIDNKLLRI